MFSMPKPKATAPQWRFSGKNSDIQKKRVLMSTNIFMTQDEIDMQLKYVSYISCKFSFLILYIFYISTQPSISLIIFFCLNCRPIFSTSEGIFLYDIIQKYKKIIILKIDIYHTFFSLILQYLSEKNWFTRINLPYL